MSTAECLSEDDVARFVEGGLTGDDLARVERHLVACDACMSLVAEVGAAPGSGETTHEEGAAAQGPLARGTHVGRYVIVEAIGAGGMGRVYSAHDPSLDRNVALKLLHPHAAGPDLEARLLREAKAMARLSHPEVITVHDAGRFGEQLFIAMELVDGGTLREWLAARARPWREVLAVFLRAGRGLARAHAAGIVHRDFKPDNVLVGTDGRVRVTDFGLARGVREADAAGGAAIAALDLDGGAPLTRTGALVGTPAYMAPEQLRGEPADARSDVYGFSVALWEALSGERPFGGKTLAEMQREKLDGKPRPPRGDRRVPRRLRGALLGGLRARPEERYASMDALLEALERASRTPRALVAGGTIALAAGGAVALLVTRGSHRGADVREVAASAPGCASNAACVDAHGGEPWVCRASDRACVPLASEDCVPMFEPEDLRAPDTVWLGALLPTRGPLADEFGRMTMDGVDLARREVASITQSLGGTGASVRVRRIALVGCDDGTDAMRAARHLVDDVGVPAILGFRSGKEIVDVAGSFLIQRHVLTMATITQNSLITRLPQPPELPRLVWRTTNDVEQAGRATAGFVHDALEPRVRRGPTRVVLVRGDDATLAPFAEAFYGALVMNGRPAVENGARYVEAVAGEDGGVDASVERALLAQPSIIVTVVDPSRTAAIVSAVDARWPPGVPRPTYLVAEDSTSILGAFLGSSADRRRRVFADSPVAMPTATGRFLIRFESAHPHEATTTINPASSYDGFYALAFATFAAGDRAVTGPELARGLARLAPPGPRIESGPSDVFAGIAALGRGGSIDLEGPSGALDFNAATGEVITDFSLLCPGVDGAGRAFEDVESGVVFHTATGTTTGAVRCP